MYDRPIEESKSLQSLLLEFLPPELEDLVQNFNLNQIKSSGTSIKQLAHQAALGNYLTYDTLSLADAAQFEDVKALFEASYHARMLECWDLAYILMCWPVGVNQTPLHEKLEKWGKYRQQIELYQELYGRIDYTIDLLCLNGIGRAYCHSGSFGKASAFHQKQLVLARKHPNLSHQILAYQGLGQVCYERSYNKAAIEYFKKQLFLAEGNDDIKQQILALCMIGRSYINMLKIKRGIKCLKFALKLAIDTKDEDSQNHVLSNLAYGYTWAGNIEKASIYFKGLIDRLSDDKYSLIYIRSLQSLGQICTFKNDAEQALIYFDEALCLIQELNHKMMKIRAFADFALFYNECKKDHRSAIKFAKEGLADAHETGSIRYILHFHVYLAIFYADLYQLHDAHIHTQEVLRLYQNYPEFIDSDQKLIVYACLGKVNWVSGQRIQAVFITIRGVIACPPWKSLNGRWILRETIKTVIQPLKQLLFS